MLFGRGALTDALSLDYAGNSDFSCQTLAETVRLRKGQHESTEL